jgi:hypothetical protein
MRVIAFTDEQDVAKKILLHLGVPGLMMEATPVAHTSGARPWAASTSSGEVHPRGAAAHADAMSDARLFLVKVGGEVVADHAHLHALADNVGELKNTGESVVVVHGGGPQVSALQEKLGQVVREVAGQRVTSEDDVSAVTASLAGTVNVGLCAALVTAGVRLGSCGTPVRRVEQVGPGRCEAAP